MPSAVFVELKASISDFQAKMGEARGELAKLSHEGSGHFANVAAVGKAAFLGVGAAAIAGSVLAVKSAADFESSLTQLVTGAGESEKSIKMVGDGMLHMAGQVGVSAQDMVKAMYPIESSGYHGAQALVVLRAALEGAKVGAADSVVTATALTTVMKNYHTPVSQAATITSEMVAAVAAGKMHMEDFSMSLGTILPIAASLNVPFTQASAAIATMTAKGTDASTATTSLRFLMSALAGPTKAAATELEKLGVGQKEIPAITAQTSAALQSLGLHTSEVADKLTHGGLQPALKMITDAIGKKFPVGSAAYEAALKGAVGGTRGLTAALELTGANMKEYQANIKSVADAHTEAGNHVLGWSKVQKDFNQIIDRARAGVESWIIVLGQKLIPIVESVIGWLERHKTAAEALAGVITGVLATAITVYIAQVTLATARTVAGALAMTAGTVRMGARIALVYAAQGAAALASAAVQIATWVSVSAAATAAFIAENIATLGIIAGITALVVAAIYLYKHWDEVWSFIKSAAQEAAKFVMGHLALLSAALGPVGVAAALLYKNWSTVWNGIKTVMSDVWGFIKPIIDGITAGVASVSSAISSLSSAASAVKGVVSTVSSAVSDTGKALHIPGFASGVENFAGGLALVGERGPEVVRLPQGSSVYPHGTGPGGGQTVNITGPHIEIHGNLDNVSLRDLHSHLDEWAHSLVTEIQSGRR